jgi:hypothetical protein
VTFGRELRELKHGLRETVWTKKVLVSCVQCTTPVVALGRLFGREKEKKKKIKVMYGEMKTFLCTPYTLSSEGVYCVNSNFNIFFYVDYFIYTRTIRSVSLRW